MTFMTSEEYKDLLLEDEINIGYEVEEDFPQNSMKTIRTLMIYKLTDSMRFMTH